MVIIPAGDEIPPPTRQSDIMKKSLLRFSLLALASSAAVAQSTSPVAQSVEKAIEGNPSVAARFNAFRAADDEIGVARGQ